MKLTANQIIEGCNNILARLASPLIDTHRGKITSAIGEETNVANLRKRAKDALLFLQDATEK